MRYVRGSRLIIMSEQAPEETPVTDDGEEHSDLFESEGDAGKDEEADGS